MDNNNNNQGQLQIELSQDVAQGQYANFVIITHSSSDFVLDFARILPGMPKTTVKSRVILAPEHAKRLLMALKDNIVRYENTFGTIKLPQPEKGTIAPFNINKARHDGLMLCRKQGGIRKGSRIWAFRILSCIAAFPLTAYCFGALSRLGE